MRITNDYNEMIESHTRRPETAEEQALISSSRAEVSKNGEQDTLLRNDKEVLETVEEVSMKMLRPDLPVVSLKELHDAVRLAL